MIENIVIKNSSWKQEDLDILFGDEEVHFSDCKLIPNLLVELDVYPSTSAARRANRDGTIPSGWTELKASKKRKLWIWNPIY